MDYENLRERKAHGSVRFPIDVYVLEKDETSYNTLYCHWHEEIEWIVVTKGSANFHIGGRDYRVRAGEAICVGKGELHSADALEGEPCHFFSVVFRPSILSGRIEDIIQLNYIEPVLNRDVIFPAHIVPESKWSKQVLNDLYEIKYLFSTKAGGYELLVKACLYRIWYLLFCHSADPKNAGSHARSEKEEKAKAVLEYIHQNYSRTVTLAELAAFSHMSKGQFCRFFRSVVNLPAMSYLNYYRVIQSTRLLSKKQCKISEIACAVGFNNISYYNRAFRRYMKCNPSEYRRKTGGF